MWADSRFKWKCCYKICWARGQKAELLVLLIFWSLTLSYIFKEKSANNSLIQNMFSPSTSSSSWVSPEFFWAWFQMKLWWVGVQNMRLWGFVRSPEGSGSSSSPGVRPGTNGSMQHKGVLCFLPLQTMPGKLLPEIGTETGWFVCSSTANPAAPYRNVRSVCFFPFSLKIHTVVMLFWTVPQHSSFVKVPSVRPVYILACVSFCIYFATRVLKLG